MCLALRRVDTLHRYSAPGSRFFLVAAGGVSANALEQGWQVKR